MYTLILTLTYVNNECRVIYIPGFASEEAANIAGNRWATQNERSVLICHYIAVAMD